MTRWAYHGITREVASFSPHLGAGSPLGPNVRLIDPPDPRLVAPGSTLAEHMRGQVRSAIADLERHGYTMAALITDCAYTSDGIFTDPVDYMQAMVEEIHAAGGVYIADEVQSGFARLGDTMWGFSRHDVLPDIVTMGKPIGNGMPLSGVVFRPQVCAEFGQNVRYFNTFGGSSIPVAAGAAVLDVFETENIQQQPERTATRCVLDSERSRRSLRTSPRFAAAVCMSASRSCPIATPCSQTAPEPKT